VVHIRTVLTQRPAHLCCVGPPSAKVRNAWSYTSSTAYVCNVGCLVKHRDNVAIVVPECYDNVIFTHSNIHSGSEKFTIHIVTYWGGSIQD
jgi:hypothetical protein